MSAASNLRAEDQFLCSICLDVFTDPVSTPCGHNYCKKCITQHWNVNPRRQCPMCKETFDTRPKLRVNTFISEMVAQFRHEAQQKGNSSDQEAAKPEEVPSVWKLLFQKAFKMFSSWKTLKSSLPWCLLCLACLIGLIYQLMEPVDNLESRMCTKHNKPLELFCKTDQTCVCVLCSVLDHKNHELIPLSEESEGKKADLRKTEARIQQMIQKRRLKIKKIKESVKMSKDAADREKAEGVQVFTALMESAERGPKELIKEIEDKQETAEKQAEGFIRDLEQEISELMERRFDVEQLSHSEDHLHLLQSFSSLKVAPPAKDWTKVSVHPSYDGTVVRAVAQLEERLRKEKKNLLAEAELKKVQQYAVDVTLDPDTAHPALILSDDGKQVNHGDVWKNLPDNPKRFTQYILVLGTQSFSSGRFYFEVQVKGKTDWILGVVRESVSRKKEMTGSPEEGLWLLGVEDGNEYTALDDPPVSLSLQSAPEKVGVFVDYEEGLVSFYDVDAAALIYSFTGCFFTQELHPFFNPGYNADGKNSAPLIISPVSQTI
ncbi:E3 ubiquitin-protein ligase TRIM39-like [Archocentrus centrarchus]|uniref:E3 ubiquitin-protein ligase TRIM39-like n=1 Tax=Archocentrus centrarchus TaxID=63155 RepID=UPI0011EA1C94|nr:E3 ubiquitin-protein ligase TRIM39-like [Archocentrus centrarchus]